MCVYAILIESVNLHLAILPPCHICFFFVAQKLACALICEATKTHSLTGVWHSRQTGAIMHSNVGRIFFILLSKNVLFLVVK